jgi:hypothetical protein
MRMSTASGSCLVTAQRAGERWIQRLACHGVRNTALDVTVRDACASLTKVKAIADKFRVVHRCQATGEILCGGNTLIKVEYTDAVVDPIKATITGLLDPAPMDEAVALPGGFRAAKLSPTRGGHRLGEVDIQGPGFDFRNDHAYGVALGRRADRGRVPRRERIGTERGVTPLAHTASVKSTTRSLHHFAAPSDAMQTTMTHLRADPTENIATVTAIAPTPGRCVRLRTPDKRIASLHRR